MQANKRNQQPSAIHKNKKRRDNGCSRIFCCCCSLLFGFSFVVDGYRCAIGKHQQSAATCSHSFECTQTTVTTITMTTTTPPAWRRRKKNTNTRFWNFSYSSGAPFDTGRTLWWRVLYITLGERLHKHTVHIIMDIFRLVAGEQKNQTKKGPRFAITIEIIIYIKDWWCGACERYTC